MVVVLLVILCQWYYVDKMQDLLSHISVADNDKYQVEYWTGQGTQSSFDIIMWHIWHLVSGSKKVWLILIHLGFLLINFAYFISMKHKHIQNKGQHNGRFISEHCTQGREKLIGNLPRKLTENYKVTGLSRYCDLK